MAINEGRERFTKAVGALVDEKDRIKDRLLVAYASQLSLVDAKADLPSDLVEEFYGIRNALSDAGMAYGYGEHAATKLHAMNDDEASALAKRIYSVFLKLHGIGADHGA